MDLELQNWVFAFVRASAFLLVLPVFSSANVPVLLRTALAAILGVVVAPGLPPAVMLPSLFNSIGGLLSEALVGLVLGFMARIVFGAFEIGGQLITTELGLNMSSILNPMSSAPTQAPGMIVFLLATTLMFTLDLHHWILAGFVRSFTLIPVGVVHLREAMLDHLLRQTSNMFVIAIQMAAPIMGVSFVVSLVFSVLGRAVPQMSVFSESFVLRTAAGLTVFGLTLPLIAQHIINALRRIPDDGIRVAEWLGTP